MKLFFILFLLTLANHSFAAYEVNKINAGDNLEKIDKRNLGRFWMKYLDPKEYAKVCKIDFRIGEGFHSSPKFLVHTLKHRHNNPEFILIHSFD